MKCAKAYTSSPTDTVETLDPTATTSPAKSNLCAKPRAPPAVSDKRHVQCHASVGSCGAVPRHPRRRRNQPGRGKRERPRDHLVVDWVGRRSSNTNQHLRRPHVWHCHLSHGHHITRRSIVLLHRSLVRAQTITRNVELQVRLIHGTGGATPRVTHLHRAAADGHRFWRARRVVHRYADNKRQDQYVRLHPSCCVHLSHPSVVSGHEFGRCNDSEPSGLRDSRRERYFTTDGGKCKNQQNACFRFCAPTGSPRHPQFIVSSGLTVWRSSIRLPWRRHTTFRGPRCACSIYIRRPAQASEELSTAIHAMTV